VFQAAAAWVPEARRAIEEIGTFVRGVVEREATAPVAASAPAPRSRSREAAVR